MSSYKSSSGKTYSSSQVEKVGSTYYVKGTSIPVTATSGGGGTKTSTPKVTTPTTPTYNSSYDTAKPIVTTPGSLSSGYYDASKGYYVGAEGMSDFQRTQSAIDYYRQNNMYDQLAAAQAYAQRMGYNIPSTPTSGGYYDPSKGYYVGAEGMSDFERTKNAIDYYRERNMSEQLAAAQAYAQRMGYDISTPKADPGPYGYITVTPKNEKEFNESWNIYSNYPGSDAYKFLQAAQGMGMSPDQARAMAQAHGSLVGLPTDEQGIQQLFYQTPEGQQFLQIQQQEEERLKMEAQILDDLFAQLQGMQAEFMQYGVEGQAALAASYTQMINELSALETQLTGQIRSQMGEDDPQMIAAIGIIKEEAKKLQQSLLEEMNQRGVVQSGLYYQAMENMNKGTMTEIQRMIASRVGDLQTQLNNAILNMASIRAGIMSNYQQSLANFQSNYMQGLNNLQLAGLNATTQYQKMLNDRYIADQQMRYQMDIARLNAETQRYGYDREYDIKKYLGDLGLDEIKLKGTYNLLNTQMAGEYGLKEAQIRAAAGGGGGGYFSPYNNDEKLTNDMVFMKTYLDELHVKYMSNNADDVGPLYNQGRVITSIEQMPHIGPEAKEWAKNQVKLWPGVAPAVAKQRKKNNKNNTVPDVYVPIVRSSAGSYFDQYKT